MGLLGLLYDVVEPMQVGLLEDVLNVVIHLALKQLFVIKQRNLFVHLLEVLFPEQAIIHQLSRPSIKFFVLSLHCQLFL